ncbi:DNA repair protein [Escherichia coli]|uniref:DNA repair protein n=1 Tax=Escherichia coli TaxID=562 RepID=A0A377DN47_ECOLX|nr:DNA repair protein [Escherichia coli]
MLEEATIQIAEASDELRHYCDRLDLDPNRLFELEQRISKQISLARKHHVSPEALPQYYQSLLEEQQQLDDQADSQETLALAVTKIISRHWKSRAHYTNNASNMQKNLHS